MVFATNRLKFMKYSLYMRRESRNSKTYCSHVQHIANIHAMFQKLRKAHSL